MSIPYRPKQASGDVGPSYYTPSGVANTRTTFSTSTVGSASMNSQAERFPLRHDHWGYPSPCNYEPMDALLAQKKSKLQNQQSCYSAAFMTTSRDNYFYNMQFSTTPGPATYNSTSTIRQN